MAPWLNQPPACAAGSALGVLRCGRPACLPVARPAVCARLPSQGLLSPAAAVAHGALFPRSAPCSEPDPLLASARLPPPQHTTTFPQHTTRTTTRMGLAPCARNPDLRTAWRLARRMAARLLDSILIFCLALEGQGTDPFQPLCALAVPAACTTHHTPLLFAFGTLKESWIER
jgi:hypothetical protein